MLQADNVSFVNGVLEIFDIQAEDLKRTPLSRRGMKRNHSTMVKEELSESTSDDETTRHRKSPMPMPVSDVKKEDLVRSLLILVSKSDLMRHFGLL